MQREDNDLMMEEARIVLLQGCDGPQRKHLPTLVISSWRFGTSGQHFGPSGRLRSGRSASAIRRTEREHVAWIFGARAPSVLGFAPARNHLTPTSSPRTCWSVPEDRQRLSDRLDLRSGGYRTDGRAFVRTIPTSVRRK